MLLFSQLLDVSTGLASLAAIGRLLYLRKLRQEFSYNYIDWALLIAVFFGSIIHLASGVFPDAIWPGHNIFRELYLPAVSVICVFWLKQLAEKIQGLPTRSELTRTNRILQSLVDSNPLGIGILDSSGKVTLWNRACEKLYGWTAEEVLGKPLPTIPPEGRSQFENLVSTQRAGTSVDKIELKRLRKDGTLIDICMWNVPIESLHSNRFSAMAVMEDITERKQIALQLNEAKQAAEKANDAKTLFLASMSHELRTPLSAIIGYSDLLVAGEMPETERRHCLNTINRNAKLLNCLITDVLDVCKIEAGEMQIEKIPTNLQEVLFEVMDTLSPRAREKNLCLKLEASELLPRTINIDPTRFKQVLLNIVGNAVKFTNHGSVIIYCNLSRSSPEREGNHLQIEVHDTGLGLSDSNREKLFRPFVQADSTIMRRFGGTGLGLFLSRQICQAMGGDLCLKSSVVGEGSVFEISLPIESLDADLSATAVSPFRVVHRDTMATAESFEVSNNYK